MCMVKLPNMVVMVDEIVCTSDNLFPGSEAGTGSVRKFEKFDTSMNYEELCLWLGSNQVPTEDQEIIRSNKS